MKKFILSSDYQPTGDQPNAINELTEGVLQGTPSQVLLGVTGSGKTFTIANVIKNLNKPTLVLSHNKTLAAQLYNEFKGFFPNNAVEYYVSYYDYYQPEAYIAQSDTYIEKDLAINEDIDKLRLAAVSALLSGRNDVIIISSVSCIYGMGNPSAFYEKELTLKIGQNIELDTILKKLIESQYVRNDLNPKFGNFRVKGDTIDIFLAYSSNLLRITFWGDEIDTISEIDQQTGLIINNFNEYRVYPANLFLTSKLIQDKAIQNIKKDLLTRCSELLKENKNLEAKRLEERVNYDIEMIKELGHCSGIENYSRYFDGREPGSRPYCLLDFFPKDYLTVIDESHVTIPQIRAMREGDRSRKEALVNYGFRLPAALDNRPLSFEEFHNLSHQTIYISATPSEYELTESKGVIVEQIIRPTGLLDPTIEVRPNDFPIDDLIDEIRKAIKQDERILVTTLTKKMAEELSQYLLELGIPTAYIHSEVDTLDRVKIMEDLRKGIFQVLVGVNLLREGLDLPEVALVAILDADKEGFLRNSKSLTQTVGRAARNINGRVIMYANRITAAMQQTIDETNRRRSKQIHYNKTHNITPKAIKKDIRNNQLFAYSKERENSFEPIQSQKVAESTNFYKNKNIEQLEKELQQAIESLDFTLAAQIRDQILQLQNKI